MSRTKQIKQLKINLDEPKAIHPNVLRAYRDSGAMHLFVGDDSPSARNEAVVFQASKVSKKPVRHAITGIYRKKVNDREYCFFHEAISSTDYFGNNVMSTRLLGRYELPIISKTMGLNPGLIKGNSDINRMLENQEKEVSIERNETTYEWEFEQIRDQLEEFYKKGIITDETKLYAWVLNKKYSKPYSFREFMDLSIDDLVLLANFAEKLSTAFKTDEINAEMLATLRKTIREELLTVSKTGGA